MSIAVAVVGTGQTSSRKNETRLNYVEQTQAAAVAALGDAQMMPDDIEAIVFSLAPTCFMGVTDADRWAVDHIWGAGKPMFRVHTGGATGGSAVHAAHSLVSSGMFKRVLVVGAERMGETRDAQYFLNQIWDPFYERSLPLQTIAVGSLIGQRYMQHYGATEQDFARIVVRQRRNALLNPNAHLKGSISIEDVMNSERVSYPLKLFDICPTSVASAAMILCDEDTVRQTNCKPAFINGIGGISSTVWIGDRVVPSSDVLLETSGEHKLAAQQAYTHARITDPANEIDVAEIYDPFSTVQYSILEALSLCDWGTAARLELDGAWEIGGRVSVNPSGGTLCSNPIAVTGLIRCIEAAKQVMHKSDLMQVPNVRNTIATAIGGSGQFVNATIFGDDIRSGFYD